MHDVVEFVVDRFTLRIVRISGECGGSGEGTGPLALCVVAATGCILSKSNQTRGGGNGCAGVVQ
jgi:hypothetical protein